MNTKIRNLLYSISNLFFFFKVIWKFRGWDHGFTTSLLRRTYERVLEDFEARPIYIGQLYEIYLLRKIVKNLEESEDDEDKLQEALDLIHKNYFRFWN